MGYEVELEAFKGPMDLLLHLIKKEEMDIYDIPIARITAQFIQYIENMKQLDLEVASDFLVMAATLMQIKARMLLPREPAEDGDEDGMEPEEDPRSELVARLIEYKRFKEAALELKEREEFWNRVYTRCSGHLLAVEPVTELVLDGLTLEDLVNAFKEVMESLIPAPPREVMREEVTVVSRIEEIRAILTQRRRIVFRDLFKPGASRSFIIASFLALLELMRLRLVIVSQNKLFGEIWIIDRESAGVGEDGLLSG